MRLRFVRPPAQSRAREAAADLGPTLRGGGPSLLAGFRVVASGDFELYSGKRLAETPYRRPESQAMEPIPDMGTAGFEPATSRV